MGSPSPSTLKALGAVCGNVCAFPGCIAPIYDTRYNILVGEVCHIEANSEKGPRYREEQPEEERQGFSNLVLMCQPHHTVIDDKSRLDEFTVPILRQMKRDHEEKSHNTILNEDLLMRLVLKVLELQTPVKPSPQLVPVIESFMCTPQHPSIDIYDFRVKLRNDGKKAVRSFCVVIEVPNTYASSNASSSHAHVPHASKPGFTVYRHSSEKDFPNFIVYPGETSTHILMVDYQLRREQYADIDESIVVLVYSEDELVSKTEYPIASFRNPDRMKQLGLTL